jgi:hypothetical protein
MIQSLRSLWELLVSWYQFLTILQLFELFWPFSICQKIVNEINLYAIEDDNKRNTMGGLQWKTFIVPKFKAYLVIPLHMDMKWQPNI